jgi:hypothetical protein
MIIRMKFIMDLGIKPVTPSPIKKKSLCKRGGVVSLAGEQFSSILLSQSVHLKSDERGCLEVVL